MSVSGIVVCGVGPGSTFAEFLTNGIDLTGALWTIVPEHSSSWAASSEEGGSWSKIAASSGAWSDTSEPTSIWTRQTPSSGGWTSH